MSVRGSRTQKHANANNVLLLMGACSIDFCYKMLVMLYFFPVRLLTYASGVMRCNDT